MENNPLEWIANRLFASWKTSVLAIGLLICMALLGIFKVYSWERLEGWFFSAVLFFFFRDGSQLKAEKAAAVDKALEKAGVAPEDRPTPPA